MGWKHCWKIQFTVVTKQCSFGENSVRFRDKGELKLAAVRGLFLWQKNVQNSKFKGWSVWAETGWSKKFFGVDPGVVSHFRCARNPIPTLVNSNDLVKCFY